MLGEMIVKKSLDKKSINDLGSPLILSYGVYYDDKTVANLLEERNSLIDEVSKMSEELDSVYAELEGYDRLLDIRDSRVYIRKYNKEYSKKAINDYRLLEEKIYLVQYILMQSMCIGIIFIIEMCLLS